MKGSHRISRVLGVCTIVGALMASAAVAGAAGGEASHMLSLINSSRSGSGLAALQSHSDLADDARAQAKRMADKGEIFHNPNLGGVTSGWEALGENVGVGPNVDRLHLAFMNSAGHRANVLGDYNYAGVGAAYDEAGALYMAIVFMRKGSTQPTTTTTTQPTTTTTSPPKATTPVAVKPKSVSPTTTIPEPEPIRPTWSISDTGGMCVPDSESVSGAVLVEICAE